MSSGTIGSDPIAYLAITASEPTMEWFVATSQPVLPRKQPPFWWYCFVNLEVSSPEDPPCPYIPGRVNEEGSLPGMIAGIDVMAGMVVEDTALPGTPSEGYTLPERPADEDSLPGRPNECV